jgi:hypothetical protein
MVPATATLGEIVDKAADQFGVRIDFDGPLSLLVPTIYFASPDKEYAYLRLAENGQPGWSLRWQNVELGELIASSEVGLFDADPLKPLFAAYSPGRDHGNRRDVLGDVVQVGALSSCT